MKLFRDFFSLDTLPVELYRTCPTCGRRLGLGYIGEVCVLECACGTLSRFKGSHLLNYEDRYIDA